MARLPIGKLVLMLMRLPEIPNVEWQPHFAYFPMMIEGKLVWWEYVDRRFFYAIDHVWCAQYRLRSE